MAPRKAAPKPSKTGSALPPPQKENGAHPDVAASDKRPARSTRAAQAKDEVTNGTAEVVAGVDKTDADAMDVDLPEEQEQVNAKKPNARGRQKAVADVVAPKRGTKRASARGQENDHEEEGVVTSSDHDPEPEVAPGPSKRARGPARAGRGKAVAANGADDSAVTATPKRLKVAPLNSLPQPPEHVRPPRNLFIWGNGDMGQFGLGTDSLGDISRPRMHSWFEAAIAQGALGAPGAGVEMVCTGGMHTLVTDEMGRVWSWGINDNASLGRLTADVPNPATPGQSFETEELETQPMVVQRLVDEGFRAVAVSAGDSVSVALGADGQLRCWGSFRSSDGLLGFDGKPGSPARQFMPSAIEYLRKETFTSVACGVDHVLALATNGRIWVWGNGQQAQLGRKIIERRKINALNPEKLALKSIVHVGSGSYHSFAVDEKGRVWAWGLNSMRQTGVGAKDGGNEDIISTPTEVKSLNPVMLGGEKVVQISGGEHHTLFLVSDGRVYACGRSDGFELGIGPIESDEPMADADADVPMDPAPEASSSRSYVADPTLLSFPPPPTAANPSPPVPDGPPAIPPINPISFISAGSRHNLAVSRGGNIYSWGFGNQCQLGLGADIETTDRPQRIRWKNGDEWDVKSAGAGGQHCVLLAVKREGKETAGVNGA